ncbi:MULTISPECIES: polysaccharide biosynthesis/export family protein [unclassified Vibrio]|uniref:polysaccharide biosynthesis/export family protein n=1 Tax=unclassified Vibrio TaxID=2614977 RepID=UPI001361142D|nr:MULTISPECIES: polysaccharide biosynthesis/export family protein [unclassified Vibrio]NAW56522.1 polysaccharide export protein [Vibrio sp. V36_P2S2PM302]NAX21876.1 polysaccharide export protein [Vibrio sp. V39_P1S14PM300]NAX25736.1 polysaccharide export protein [Vibrio sp. V38_P2S17PM301]NAX31274.1 polysaccharide export protein [Vibrio sp. V37_P2S8PM304]
MKKWLVQFLVVMFLVSPWAQAGTEPSSSSPAQTEVYSSNDDYRLGTGDQISILVYGEPDMSMKLKVTKIGEVNFPYIGNVRLTGKTPAEIETDIETRLRGDYLRNPMVTVNLEQFRKFYITGEVTSPNGYEYQPRLTVEQAIALAGGFTDRADRGDINIRLPDNQLIKNVKLTHPVNPGDTVIVEQSFF